MLAEYNFDISCVWKKKIKTVLYKLEEKKSNKGNISLKEVYIFTKNHINLATALTHMTSFIECFIVNIAKFFARLCSLIDCISQSLVSKAKEQQRYY